MTSLEEINYIRIPWLKPTLTESQHEIARKRYEEIMENVTTLSFPVSPDQGSYIDAVCSYCCNVKVLRLLNCTEGLLNEMLDGNIPSPFDFYGSQIQIVELEQDNFKERKKHHDIGSKIKERCPYAKVVFHKVSFQTIFESIVL